MDPRPFTTLAHQFPSVLDEEVLHERGQALGLVKRKRLVTPFRIGCPSQTDACNLESHGLSQSFPDCEPEADWKFAKFVKT